MFYKASGTLAITEINFISFNFYYKLVIQSFIGVNIVILGLDRHYLLYRINDFSLKETVYLSVLLTLILLPLSMLFISYILKFNSKLEWKKYTNKGINYVVTKDDKAMFLTICLFTLISFLSIVYTFISIGHVPLFQVIFGSAADEAARLRIMASREFGGIVYIRNIFAITLTPLLSYIAFAYSKQSKYIGWKLLFWILFLLSISIETYSLAKGPVLFYILSFIIINIYINGKISFKKLLRYAALISILIVVFYLFFAGGNRVNFFDYNSGPLGRVVLGQIAGLYFHYQYFPDFVPFLNGQSFPAFILNLFDIESIRSARLVMEIMNPRGVEEGVAGVMNTLFIGEAYANYGWLGVFFGTIWVGVVVQLMYIIFIRLPKNPITIALFTHYTLSLPLTGGFIDFIYNAGMIIVLLLMLAIYYIAIINHKLLIRTNTVKAKILREV